ncbi:MAG: hypothetical protein M3Q61_03410 [Chloroflexota bacterium]|nr:hypothetical protein [Chloroflexota bacterium]
MTACTASTQARSERGDALGDAEALALGDALGDAEGLGRGDAEGLALGDAEGLALGDADALGDGEACVTVMLVTPFWVVALTSAPDAPMRKMPEIAPALA